MKLFLTSSPIGVYRSDEPLNYSGFNPANGMVDALHTYDFVILGGGHVPTEMAFFRSIGLAEKFEGFTGIAMGISAGTMNCARIVYAEPEMPGEATDPTYERFIPGLGLTEFNILQHYNAVKNDIIDGMRLIEDIAFGDSFGHTPSMRSRMAATCFRLRTGQRSAARHT